MSVVRRVDYTLIWLTQRSGCVDRHQIPLWASSTDVSGFALDSCSKPAKSSSSCSFSFDSRVAVVGVAVEMLA